MESQQQSTTPAAIIGAPSVSAQPIATLSKEERKRVPNSEELLSTATQVYRRANDLEYKFSSCCQAIDSCSISLKACKTSEKAPSWRWIKLANTQPNSIGLDTGSPRFLWGGWPKPYLFTSFWWWIRGKGEWSIRFGLRQTSCQGKPSTSDEMAAFPGLGRVRTHRRKRAYFGTANRAISQKRSPWISSLHVRREHCHPEGGTSARRHHSSLCGQDRDFLHTQKTSRNLPRHKQRVSRSRAPESSGLNIINGGMVPTWTGEKLGQANSYTTYDLRPTNGLSSCSPKASRSSS